VKRQMLELESQRSKVETERDELLRIRAALEGECESRLKELQSLAEAVDEANIRTEESNHRIRQLSAECLEMRSKNEVEKDSHLGAQTDLDAVKGELREVLVNCQSLQVKVYGFDAEREALKSELRNRVAQCELALEGAGAEEVEKYKSAHNKLTIRMRELQSVIDAGAETEERHIQTHQTNRKMMEKLQKELDDAEAALQATDGQNRQQLQQRTLRISELERDLEVSRGEGEAHKRQHASYRTEIQEFNESVTILQASEGSHSRNLRQKDIRIQELELELEANKSERNQQVSAERRKTQVLTLELDNGRASDADRARLEKTHRAAIVALEEQLSDAIAGQDKAESLARTNATQKRKIAELDQQLEESEAESRKNQREATRYAELEREAVRQFDDAVMELESQRRSLHAQEQGVDQRVQQLHEELATERQALISARSEVNGTREVADQVRIDAEAMVNMQEELRVSKMAEFEERYSQLKRENETLQTTINRSVTTTERFSIASEPRESLPPPTATMPNVSIQPRKSLLARKSLFGQVKSQGNLAGLDFLPGNLDAFVGKVRASIGVVAEALKAANEAHDRSITAQVQRLLESTDDQVSLTSLIGDYGNKRVIDTERRSAADEVEAAESELKGSLAELPIHRNLKPEESAAVQERLDLEILKCQDELALLQADSALEDVPEHVLLMLRAFHQTGPSTQWKDGLSPMHWACQNGNQALVRYLYHIEGGKELLQSHDNSGRNPLYYAQLGKHRPLVLWLQEEDRVSGPVHKTSDAPPEFERRIPDQYMKVLEQIRTHGWRAMSWRDGFTMLHWASKHGHEDVCKYLVNLDANPSDKDGQGRSPIDMATTAGHQDLAITLGSLRSTRRQSRVVR